MAHRRAFADNFPIGTWGAEPEQYPSQRQHHIDTCVKGGDPTSAFYRKEALRFGYRSLSSVHLNNMALWKEEAPNPIIACLQLSDEPDWVTHPQQVLLQDNLVRAILSPCPNHDHSLQKCYVLRVCADRGFAMHGSLLRDGSFNQSMAECFWHVWRKLVSTPVI